MTENIPNQLSFNGDQKCTDCFQYFFFDSATDAAKTFMILLAFIL